MIPEANRQKIDILFREWDSLREEIIHRTNNGFALLGVAGLVLTWLLSRNYDLKFWLMLGSFATIAFGAAKFCFVQIRRCGIRKHEIEQQINSLAGDELLVWEDRWGYAKTGHHPISDRPTLKAAAPAQ